MHFRPLKKAEADSNEQMLSILLCTNYVTFHGKKAKKVMTRAQYFNTLDKRRFL